MFYLEVVGFDGQEENHWGNLFTNYEEVKETLTKIDWIRFVVTELKT